MSLGQNHPSECFLFVCLFVDFVVVVFTTIGKTRGFSAELQAFDKIQHLLMI